MKKYRFLIAVTGLLLAALACQTVTGSWSTADSPSCEPAGERELTLPAAEVDGGGISVGGESEFPMPADASGGVSVEVLIYISPCRTHNLFSS